jgi:hypothetical protein
VAEPRGTLAEFVAQRVELLQGEIAEIVAATGSDSDPDVRLKALSEAHTRAIGALCEIAVTLAGEIDRLKRQSDPHA